jgi:pilus assembly protein Flp/PilA
MMLVTTSRTERFQPAHRRIATSQRQVHCIALGEAQAALSLSYRQFQFRYLFKEISMQGMISRVQRFLISEDGPTAVEYAVMLALILVVCITVITGLGSKISGTFTAISTSI